MNTRTANGAKGCDLTWLPPQEEWDFRSITNEECRFACHWEYARQIHAATSHASRLIGNGVSEAAVNDAKVLGWRPSNYHGVAREMFPRAWLAMTTEQRGKVIASFHRLPAVAVRRLDDFLQRMNWSKGIPDGKETARVLEHTWVIQPHFGVYGAPAVVAELRAWARDQSKRYRRTPRARAAELPFDELKWLAVLRLEGARCAANDAMKTRAEAAGTMVGRKDIISVEKTAVAIKNYRKHNPIPDPNGVLPIYRSAGAWTKAWQDAERCKMKVLSDTSQHLAGWC